MGIWPQQALLGWCTGKQDWVAATGSRALKDSWTSGKGVEALAGGCCEPRVRRNGTHRVVADRVGVRPEEVHQLCYLGKPEAVVMPADLDAPGAVAERERLVAARRPDRVPDDPRCLFLLRHR